MMWDWWNFGWWSIFGMLMMVAFWGGIIWLIVWAVRRSTGSSQVEGRNALDIAKERYARGEITREQFEEIKKNLGS
jgi:putative membrane protein